MNDQVRNALIAKLMAEGQTLSDVQRFLKDEHDVVLTYMELKMLALDLEVDWTKFDKAKPEEPAEEQADEDGESGDTAESTGDTPEGEASDGEPAAEEVEAPGFTTVNVSKIVRPGAAISGDVTFKSGARAEWFLDQMGRLGLNPKTDLQPDEDDMRDFEAELRRALQV
ncbi:MAG: hypothetical protein ACI8W8_003511 [Rhodothermales bacterium]|jgi:hypothetical protein